MKRTVFFAMLFLGVFTVYAQSIDKDSYTEITYDNFMAWLDAGAGNEIPERFKMRLEYDGPSSPGYNFKDGDENIIITSETGVNFKQGQDVIVYFTARGPLVWDRSIDLIEADGIEPDIIEAHDVSRIAPPFDPYSLDSDSLASSPSDISSAGGIGEIMLVPGPERPPVPGSVRILVPPDTGRVIIRVDQDSGGNLWLSLEESGNPPPPNAYPPNPSASRPAAKSGPPPEVKIVPKISSLKDEKLYKLQVGAFTHQKAADDLAATLRKEGFFPDHEKSGAWNRVVITRVRGSDVGGVAERLGAVGIKTVWVRE
jgi:hypothetical protein